MDCRMCGRELYFPEEVLECLCYYCQEPWARPPGPGRPFYPVVRPDWPGRKGEPG